MRNIEVTTIDGYLFFKYPNQREEQAIIELMGKTDITTDNIISLGRLGYELLEYIYEINGIKLEVPASVNITDHIFKDSKYEAIVGKES